jgi:hypothetical protein
LVIENQKLCFLVIISTLNRYINNEVTRLTVNFFVNLILFPSDDYKTDHDFAYIPRLIPNSRDEITPSKGDLGGMAYLIILPLLNRSDASNIIPDTKHVIVN